MKKIIKAIRGIFAKKTNKKQVKNRAKSGEKTYVKKRLLTQTEMKFYCAIAKYVPQNYILLPQINLASVIARTDEHRYQNELYRNIDFAIFDRNYTPILLIEINDKTHKEKKRIARDIKVKEICENAGLPLITFWTEYGVNEEYIAKRVAEYI